MRPVWKAGLALGAAAAVAGAVAWAQINPQIGSLRIYFGPTYGAVWVPGDQAMNVSFSAPPAIGNVTPNEGHFAQLYATGQTPTTGSMLKVGRPGWLTAINGATESIAATSSLSNTGQIGVIGAAKTADAGTTETNAIGLLGYAWNNNTSTTQYAYGTLTIGRHGAGAPATNSAIGIESDAVENTDYSAQNGITPYNMGPTTGPLTASVWAASGDGFDLPSYNTSVALGITNNGTTFASGIVISSTALYPRAPGGFGRAIDMASTHVIHWDNPNPALATNLWADDSGLHGVSSSQVIPAAFPGNVVGWTLSSNFTGSDGEVDIWNSRTAPGPKVFSFRKKSTDSTQVELASINFGGELRMAKAVIFAAPGAGFGMMQWVAGTTAGTCKLVALAGTSATPTTIVDNVGSGC